MLLRYSVRNFKAIGESVELSLIASSEKIHLDHVARPKGRRNYRVLRTAAIYGANASGKSSLVHSMKFLQNLITSSKESDDREDVPFNKFFTQKEAISSKFEIEFFSSGEVFRYILEISGKTIHSEELYKYDSRFSEEFIFSRKFKAKKEESEFMFGKFMQDIDDEDDRRFVSFVARATPNERPFLKEARDKKIVQFKKAADWFFVNLVIISPGSSYRHLEMKILSDNKFREFYKSYVGAFDTGIEDISVEIKKALPEDIEQTSKDKPGFQVVLKRNGQRYSYFKNNDEINLMRLKTSRKASDGTLFDFSLFEESDGTNRLLDLLPIIYDGDGKNSSVFVVDEIDRSLHPLLAKRIIEDHSNKGADSQTQLIFSTHETQLLDLNLLRRDEVWFTEKDRNHNVKLYSLHDFQPRYDKDVKKDYLVGRFGAIPFLGTPSFITDMSEVLRSETLISEVVDG